MHARLLADSRSSHPPLVYLPGLDGTGEFLFGTAAPLSERFRLLRMAYESDPGEACSGAGYVRLAASVAARIEESEVEPPLVLAESFGVALALRLALDHPGFVAGLALVNGFARYDRRARIRLGVRLSPFLPPPLFDLGRRLFAPRGLFGPRVPSAELLRAFHALPGGRFDPAYRCRLAMVAGVDLRPELGRIPHTTHVFASDRDRIVPAVRCARVLADGLSDARVEVLEGCGHAALPFDSERWVRRLVALASAVGA